MKRIVILAAVLAALASCDKPSSLNRPHEVVDHNLEFKLSADPCRSCDNGTLRLNLTVADTLAGFTLDYCIDGMPEIELYDSEGEMVVPGPELVVGNRNHLILEYTLPRLSAGDHDIVVTVTSGDNAVERWLEFSVDTTPPTGITHDLPRTLLLGNSHGMTVSLQPEVSDWSVDSVTSDNSCLSVTASGDGTWSVTARNAGAGSLTVKSGDKIFKIACTVMWQPVLTLDYGYAKGYLYSILASGNCPSGKVIDMEVFVTLEGQTQYRDTFYLEADESYSITGAVPVGLPIQWHSSYGTYSGFVNPDEMQYWISTCYEYDAGGWEQYGPVPYRFTSGELNIYPYVNDAYALPLQVVIANDLNIKMNYWKTYGWKFRIDRENQ